jgi:2',3'-cyclic-nucleotide 2'-phosphodiesterase
VRVLFLGDVVGAPGLNLIRRAIPKLKPQYQLSLVIANAENTTNGTGLTPHDYRQLRTAGIDAITLGDHIYKKFDIADVLNKPTEPIVKPANFPAESPGRDHHILQVGEHQVGVISLLGRTFMRSVDCPFAAVDRVLKQLPESVKLIFVDIHAEATADKYLMAHHLNGRVTAVLGTHTHIATADEQILGQGTAFQCDVGMSGPYDSILGRRVDRVLATTIHFTPSAFDVATGDVRLSGAIIDCDPNTGRATAIERFVFRESEL